MESTVTQFGPKHFLNRELSWLAFNQRVLDEALDPTTPLLERVKFFCITSSNLDEFFEVRVAGIKQQIESDVVERSVDGLTASECFRALNRRVRTMVEAQFRCWREELVPALAKNGICFRDVAELDAADRLWLESYFLQQVWPVLTPLGLDPTHPFPQLLNKTLNLIVQVEVQRNGEAQRRLAVVQVPRGLPRLVKLPRDDSRQDYVFLAHLVGHYLANLFPGTTLLGHWQFRVTRNSELYIDEEDSANLLKAVENELHNRRKGEAVRLEVSADCPPEIRAELLTQLHLAADDLYIIDGPINLVRLLAIVEGDHSPELRDAPFIARPAAALRDQPDIFAVVRERDVLLHHPFDSFSSVVDFLAHAAEDADVLAIKMTLYRTGGDPRIVGALMNAVRNGKQVTAVVELKARFDEANNIAWARRLEEAGVHVVYGLVGYKVHSKLTLIVRRDPDGIRRYVHLATGNYNATTSRFYTDLGLLTCRPDFGDDASALFNLLTGICQFQGAKKLLIAPFELHSRMVQLIERETANAQRGLPARIIAKMNSLVDREVIEALYRASQAGVKVDLIVRGVCCLRPGVAGVSEHITVRSVVDRFLEHSRIFYFENACQPEVFVGSADWMPRNFFRRVEVVFPIEDGNLRDRVKRELLDTVLADNVKARVLSADGTYRQLTPKRGGKALRSQAEFMRLATSGTVVKGKANQEKKRAAAVKLRQRP
ncbi:MAG: Polyphosphate kinase [Verrucomicrobiota bacterium]|jgi:polyphosphate kinase